MKNKVKVLAIALTLFLQAAICTSIGVDYIESPIMMAFQILLYSGISFFILVLIQLHKKADDDMGEKKISSVGAYRRKAKNLDLPAYYDNAQPGSFGPLPYY